MSDLQTLEEIIHLLEEVGIPYMVTGSLASTHYSMPRTTQDIDVVIAGHSRKPQILVENLPSAEFYAALNDAIEAFHHESMFNVVDMRTGWKVDFIMLKSSPYKSRGISTAQAWCYPGRLPACFLAGRCDHLQTAMGETG